MIDPTLQVVKLRAALSEVLAQRDAFSEETYTQIIIALYDRIRLLQTRAPQRTENDEIRLATVMFIDVVNSTEMARHLQADNWKKIISDGHALLSQSVRHWGGEIGQYLGDGLLCFFGVRRSQEDDPLRAVYCALEAHEVIARYADQISAEYAQDYRDRYRDEDEPIPDLQFTIRIAMSTGQVVVGMVGDAEKQELLAMGTPTNLASRLQAICEPGKVLIDANTYYRVRDQFEVEANELRRLKGFEAPVEYYTVLGKRQQEYSPLVSRQIAGITIPFVGRDKQLQQIVDLFGDALAQSYFPIVTIYGEIGIGKSRLLQEALDEVQNASLRVFTVTANYENRTTPYSFIHDLLAQHCNLSDDTPVEVAESRIIQFASELWPNDDAITAAHVMGFMANFGFSNSLHVRTLKLGSSQLKHSAFPWIARWFQAVARDKPLIIAVDNLHWLDFESLELLEYLVQELNQEAGLLIATARPEFDDIFHNYMDFYPQKLRLDLERISESSISALITRVLESVENVPDRLQYLIQERAEGNPLFVEEFLRMLFDNGVFENIGDGRWRTNRLLYATLESTLPNGLLALLQARLDELQPGTRRVIQIAAVVGQTFWEGALVAAGAPENIRAELINLEKRGIIIQHSESSFDQDREYSFRHILYREAAYSMLTRPNRKTYHHQIADWLENQVITRPEYLEILAEHYLKADQNQDALVTYLHSAENLFQQGLLPKTLRVIEAGWDVARSVPREVAIPIVSKLWLLRGRALEELHEYQEASAASKTAIMLMEELPLEEMLEERVLAALTLSNSQTHLGQYDDALQTLKSGHSLLPKENVWLHAAVLRSFGLLYRAQGKINESLAYQQQAFTLAEESQDHREIARVLAMLADISLERGDFATSLAYTQRALTINRHHGNIYHQILDLRHLAHIYRALFAYDMALTICEEAGHLQDYIHYQDALVALNLGLCLIHKGDTATGMSVIEEVNQREYQNVYTYQKVKLAFIQSLILTRQYEACHDIAVQLHDEFNERNPILYGRILLWLGVAKTRLGDATGHQLLLQALENELEYGGRDAWICYYMLSVTAPTPEASEEYRYKALSILEAIVSSLHAYPDLQAIIRRSRFMQDLNSHSPLPDL